MGVNRIINKQQMKNVRNRYKEHIEQNLARAWWSAGYRAGRKSMETAPHLTQEMPNEHDAPITEAGA